MSGEAIGKLEKKRGVRMIENGRVAERFNVPDSKSGVGVTLPWVQIPPRPRFKRLLFGGKSGGCELNELLRFFLK